MKTKFSLSVFLILFITSAAFAQEFAVDKGATWLAGTVSFSSSGGELFEDYDGNSDNVFNLSPTINYFIGKNFFIGGGLEFSNEKQGDYNSNSIGVGPQIGYAFGTQDSKVFPFVDLGLRYYGMSIDYGSGSSEGTGRDIFLGAGVVVPLRAHLGLTFEAGYHMLNVKEKDYDENYSGNILGIGIGIAGLLY